MYTLDDIRANIGCDFEAVGSRDAQFATFDSIYDARPASLTWLRATGDKGAAAIAASPAAVIVCSRMAVPTAALAGKCLLMVDEPQVAFMRLVKNMLQPPALPPGIHSSAVVSPRAEIGEGVHIGPFCVIGACRIGRGSVVKAHSTIHDGAELGERVLVSEHCNVGGEGFSHIQNERGELENMLHIGRTVLEDDVELFPYTNVDKGTLGVTRVGRGTKIDHYCHIGHNTVVGRNTVITANVTTLGGVQIGDGCWIGTGTIFRDMVKIGHRVTTGMGSLVTKDIPEGQTWAGVPARELGEFKELQRKLGAL